MNSIVSRNFVVVIFLMFIGIVGVSAQTTLTNELVNESEAMELIKNLEESVSSAELSNWFIGAKKEVNLTKSNESTTQNRSAIVSKKEQYLKSGFSKKTILIRSILKKANSYIKATV